MSKYRTIQIVDDTWYELGDYDRDICCHCSLVHDTEYKMEKGKILFRTRVNARETAKLRKKHGISVTNKVTSD